jgi:ribosome maturation factor RimP
MDTALLHKVAQQAADACQVELYHLEWLASGRRNLLRVFIDKPEGVTVGDCERVSRELSVLLDVEEPIRGRYVLEVSSPGMDRRLHLPAHYRANVGRAVEVKTLRADEKGRRKWVGTLESAEDDGFVLALEGGERKSYRYAEIESCRLQITI